MSTNRSPETWTELVEGESVSIGTDTLTIERLRIGPYATHEGKLEDRRTATLSLSGRSIAVVEGSVLRIGGSSWRVVRIRRVHDRGLIRLRAGHDDFGRFAAVVAGFQDGPRAFDASLLFFVEGVSLVHDVIGRLDGHPDVVGSFAEPLQRAEEYLRRAREGLVDAGVTDLTLAYIDHYLRFCEPALDIIQNSTQQGGA